jgi:hypothetical protein
MITIYQIKLTEEEFNLVNEKGHDAVPAQKVKLDTSVFGPSKFKAEDFNFYSNDMDVAFAATNLWNNMDIVDDLGSEMNFSTSVGDIMEIDGTFHMVQAFGFEEIEVLK